MDTQIITQSPNNLPVEGENPVVNNENFSPKKFWASRDGWIIGVSLLTAQFMGYFSSIMMIVSYFMGGYVANWLKKNDRLSKNMVNIIAWSNLITWAISFPFFNLGLFTSKFTDTIADHDQMNEKKYKRLATLSYVLSILISLAIWFMSTSIRNMEKYGK